MINSSDLLTIEQAAKFLNVSETSLRRWTNDGRLTCIRLGSKNVRRFRREDLIAFLRLQPAQSPKTSAQATSIGGIPLIHGSHLCSFYSNDDGRAKLAVEFLADGLQQSCACYLISTPEAARDTLKVLDKYRPDYQKDIDAGRLILSEYTDSIPDQIQILEASFKISLANGAKTIRVVGNVTGSRMAATKPFGKVLDYEESYEKLLAKRFPLVTLCQYDARGHNGLEMAGILKCHKDVFCYPPERLLS